MFKLVAMNATNFSSLASSFFFPHQQIHFNIRSVAALLSLCLSLLELPSYHRTRFPSIIHPHKIIPSKELKMTAATADEHKARGNDAFAKEDFEEAIKHYSEAIKVDATNHVFFSNRSASYAGLKQWNEAISDAKECIRLNPEFMKGYYRLATAQLELEEYDAAQATIKQGLTLDANNSQLLKVLRSIKQAKKAATNKAMAPVTTANANTINGVGGKLDDATRRELYDLQVQHSQTTKEFNTVQANLTKIQREFSIQEITHSELSDHANDGRAYYRTIGKVFYKSNRDGVMDHLQSNMDERQKKQVDMKQKLEYLERRLKSQQQNMQELAASATE